jgi:tetratricopeptide (TPR) repeat protein
MELKNIRLINILVFAIFSFVFFTQPAFLYARPGSDSAAQNAASKSEAVALNEAALKLAASRNYEAAVEKLEEASAMDPDNQTIKNNLSLVINSYAVSVSKSDPRLAAELFEKGTAAEGASYNVYMNYGVFLSNHARYEEAGVMLDKALDTEKIEKNDEINIRVNLGMVYFKRGFFDEAIVALDPAAEKFKSAEAYYLKGRICYTQGKFDEAVDNLEASVKYGKNGEYSKASAELLKKVKKEAKVESNFQSQSLYHFKIQFDGEKRNDVKVDKVAQFLEEAYNEVGSYFNHYPEAPTQVIIYSKSQFKQASDSPVWVAGLYDGKIRLPLNDILTNADELKKLILHEYTHAVIFNLSRGYCPVWLNEGFAQTLEGEGISEKQTANVKKQIAKKQIFDMKSLEGSFLGITPESSVVLAYDQSLSFTGFLIEKIGQSQLVEILPEFSHGKSMQQIFKENFYSSYDKLQAEWYESVSK